MNYDIKCSKCAPLANTHTSSHLSVLSNGFLR